MNNEEHVVLDKEKDLVYDDNAFVIKCGRLNLHRSSYGNEWRRKYCQLLSNGSLNYFDDNTISIPFLRSLSGSNLPTQSPEARKEKPKGMIPLAECMVILKFA